MTPTRTLLPVHVRVLPVSVLHSNMLLLMMPNQAFDKHVLGTGRVQAECDEMLAQFTDLEPFCLGEGEWHCNLCGATTAWLRSRRGCVGVLRVLLHVDDGTSMMARR